MTSPAPRNEDTLRGFAFALAAYVMWGFLPLYMHRLAHISPAEVIAHRVLWSIPVAGAILWSQGQVGDLKRALSNPRMLGMAALTAALISVNWGFYVWAVTSGHALEAAMGYYINPLFSVFLSAVLLGERLNVRQKTAVGLAALAVLFLAIEGGQVPWVGLALTVTWGFYAYLKKSLPVGPNQGFLLEVLLLSAPAVGYILWLAHTGRGHFLAGSPSDSWLLWGCGLVTAIPLIAYANGAKGLRLSTIAIMQYIAPTMIFLTAVFLFDEPLGGARRVAFPMIWLALVIYTSSLLPGRSKRTARRASQNRQV